MLVLGLAGSPRRGGNTETLLDGVEARLLRAPEDLVEKRG
jgi:hypothetical protein